MGGGAGSAGYGDGTGFRCGGRGAASPSAASFTVNFDETDTIKFKYRRTTKVGKGNASANKKIPPGGLFIVTKVQGTEQRAAPPDTTLDMATLQFNGLLRLPGGAPLLPLPSLPSGAAGATPDPMTPKRKRLR